MNTRSIARLLMAVCFVVPAAIAGQSSEAVACGESIAFEVDPNVLMLSQAEGNLNAGKPLAAALDALKVFPKIKDAKPGSSALLPRAQRIVAMSIVRTDGLLNAGKQFTASTSDERRANLEWAVATLRRLSAAKKNNPAAQTDLGEALATLPETQSEALASLDKLARKDLVTSANGYATLAKLRKASGDDLGHDAAMKKYEALAKKGKPATPAAPVAGKVFST
jgi:TPR repeat protein